jgi:hypothetical protein
MIETLSVVCLCLSVVALAVVLLAWRDVRHRRRTEEKVPVSEQIARIRKDAAFMVEQFESLLERVRARAPEQLPLWTTIIGFHKRLEALAAMPEPAAEEAERLAKEADEYLRANRAKGIFVAVSAKRLAELSRRLKDDDSTPRSS